MFDPVKIQDNLDASSKLFSKFVKWSSSSYFKQILVVFVFQAIIIFLPYAALYNYIIEKQEFSGERIDLIRSKSLIQSYESNVDFLNVCINNKDLEKNDWYCEKSKELFVMNVEGEISQIYIDELVKNDLYDAMKIAITTRIKGVEVSNILKERYSKDFLIDFFSSKIYFTFSILLTLFFSFTLLYIFKREYEKK